ncbi:MAG: conjugal transfer protein TraF [Campylobacterota bacterium]|nr:conjugal transfer protein TraF [Campylobacterota bacterium]
MKHLVLTLLFILSLQSADSFYSDKKDTWFFGAEPVNEIDENETAPEPAEDRMAAEEEFVKNIPWENLDMLSAEEFQAAIKKTKEIAVVHPAPKNISAYIRLQKHATDQSDRFMKAWQLAVIQDPSLTDNLPQAKRTRDNKRKNEQEEKDDFIKANLNKITLVMFYDEERMGDASTQIFELNVLKQKYGIAFQSISIQSNPSYENALGLQVYPENWYYFQDASGSSWRRIGAGVRGASELIDNLILVHNSTENDENSRN